MNAKKIILATISFFILTMALAYPWHLIWFHDLYQEMGAFTRQTPIMQLGMLAVIVQGIVIAYLYQFWYRGGNTVIQGIKFSLMLGLVVYSVMGFSMAAKINISPVSTFLIYSAAFQFIQFLITGVFLGLIYGRQNERFSGVV
jgi:hypothetical protein